MCLLASLGDWAPPLKMLLLVIQSLKLVQCSLDLSVSGSRAVFGGTTILDDEAQATDLGWGFESLSGCRQEAGLAHR